MRKIVVTAFALLFSFTASAALQDIVTKGSTSRSVTVDIIDSTDGTPETGVVFNTSGIDLWYRREGAARVAITEATLAALTTAWSSGGFLHVSDGTYRLDLPDAAFATGANYVDFGGTVTGMIVIGGRVRLVDYSLEDAVRGTAGTALPNAAAGASGGVLISGSNSGTTTLGALTVTGATTLTGNVAMSAGLTITQSTTNGSGISVTGNGTGNGITATGGATGNGFSGVGGSTSGAGFRAAGTAGNSPAMTLVGQGSAAGLLATGGATGAGFSAVGGATSGPGFSATATSGNGATFTGGTNGNGVASTGAGTGAGEIYTGGATGSGFSLVGGSTSGNAIATAYTAPLGPVKGFGIIESGNIVSATSTTAVLRSATSFADSLIAGSTLVITGGTGAGQSRSITAWTNTTDTATVATWTTNPDTTSTYEVWGTSASSGSGGGLDAAATRAALGLASPNLDTQLSGIQSDADNLQTRVPTALVSGRMDASVGAYQTGLTPLQPTTSGRTLDVSATGEAGIDLANVGSPTTALNLSGTTIGTATNLTNAPTSGDLTATMKTSVQTAAAAAITAYDPPTGAEMDARTLPSASYATASNLATVGTTATGIKTTTDKLDTALELDGSVYRYTTNALENAPTGSGGSSDWSVGEKEQIRHRLGIDGTATAPSATPSLATSASQTVILNAINALNDMSPAELRDLIMEDQGGGVSAGCINAVLLAFAAGDISTTGSTTTWRDPSNGEVRITSTVTSNGNRTASITCPTY